MNFKEVLKEKEEILYEGRSAIGAENRNTGVFLFIIIFVILFQILLIWSMSKGIGSFSEGIDLDFILIFLASVIFLVAGIYGYIYNIINKKKHTDNNYYCVTNERIIKYVGKKNKIYYGNIANYKDIVIENIKDNCGDITMNIILDKNEINTPEGIIKYRDMIMNPNPEDMPSITFEYVRDPEVIKKIICEARDNKIINLSNTIETLEN